jgi:3-phosphoshikimate 1-carboxyvinyltransferase
MVPVIAIDGPTASGKGTVAQRVADALGWHYLDSGALYRLAALAARRAGVALDDEPALARLAANLPIEFSRGRILLAGDEVTDAIRAEAVGEAASRIAVLGALRAALLDLQRDFRRAPGLVADGRDMASVVFPDASLKVFLTASAEARAERRYKQLIEKGFSANLDGLLRDLRARDARDAGRTHAPLVAAEGAVVLDSTPLTVLQTVQAVLDRWSATGLATRAARQES